MPSLPEQLAEAQKQLKAQKAINSRLVKDSLQVCEDYFKMCKRYQKLQIDMQKHKEESSGILSRFLFLADQYAFAISLLLRIKSFYKPIFKECILDKEMRFLGRKYPDEPKSK